MSVRRPPSSTMETKTEKSADTNKMIAISTISWASLKNRKMVAPKKVINPWRMLTPV